MMFLEMLVLCCFPVYYSMEQKYQPREVRNFSEIPKDLFENFDKMGIDDSPILNEYEGKYLNYIFKIDTSDFNLIEKKVGFLGSKKRFFHDERMCFYRDEKTGVGGCVLYIFNAAQKAESGGYDAAIGYWSKFILPVEKVVKGLKTRYNVDLYTGYNQN